MRRAVLIALALALLTALTILATAEGIAGVCCAYKGRDSACVPCRPTRDT